MTKAKFVGWMRSAGRTRSLNRWAGWLGGTVLVLMLLVCLGSMPFTLGRSTDASAAAPRRYEATNLDAARLPPFWAAHERAERARLEALASNRDEPPRYLLGTDRLGRDLLVRLLAGGGISLTIGLAAAFVAVLIGTSYGMVAGYVGGRTDAALMRAVDVLYGLPNVLLVVLLAVAVDGLLDRFGAGLGPAARQSVNVITLLLAIGGVTWLTMARVIRGQVLSLRRQPFMEACRAIGVPARRQFIVHLLPNLLGPILVYATLTVPTAILAESFLSFLGIGVKEPLPSWGNLAADGLAELNTVRSRWWMLLWPCLLIAATLLSLNFVGESLRERLDPRSKPRGR
jgi:ABC-type dipeptide/oligopeptide/nickel transport system permease subunit